jgi:hypothetical protein
MGARDRYFAFLPHPSAHTFKTLATCYRPDELGKLRKIAETALSAGVIQCPAETAPANEPEAGPPAATSTPVQVSKNRSKSWGIVLVLVAVLSLGTWAYRSASHQERALPAIPKPPASQKCAKCGSVIKPGNQYCINCGAKAEVLK